MIDFILDNVLNKDLKGYIFTTIAFLLGGLLIWAGVKSLGFLGTCAGVVLLLISLGMFMFINGMSNQGDVIKIIKKGFPPENHAQLLALYETFRERKSDALFVNILKKAKSNLDEVERLSEIAVRVNYDMRAWLDIVGFEK